MQVQNINHQASSPTPAPVCPRRHPRIAGLTLIESMIVLTVLSIVGIGVAVGLQAAVRIPKSTDDALAFSTELTSEMEAWRAVAFGVAPWPANLPYVANDTVNISIGGRTLPYGRNVTIQNWDPNDLVNNSSPKSDFVRVQITVNGHMATGYLTKPI